MTSRHDVVDLDSPILFEPRGDLDYSNFREHPYFYPIVTVMATCSSFVQLLLCLLTVGPWLLLIVYDFFLYVFRALTYEIPYVGGRARGRQRPRAPSLAGRPTGHRRAFSIGGPIISGGEPDNKDVLRDRSRNTTAVQGSRTIDKD